MVLVRKGFVLKEAQNYSTTTLLLGAFDWWKDIDESEEWQEGIYYTLCAAYGLVSLVALVLLFLFFSFNLNFVIFFYCLGIYLSSWFVNYEQKTQDYFAWLVMVLLILRHK